MHRLALALTLLVVPALSQAQVRGGGAGGGHAVIMSPRPMAHAAPSYASHPSAAHVATARAPQGPTGTVYTGHRLPNNAARPRSAVSPSAFGSSSFLPDFTGVPGLGFDYVHYAAVHPGGNRRGGRGGAYLGYFPFFDSGFLLPYSQSYVSPPVDETPSYEGQVQGSSDAPDGSANVRTPYGPRTISSYDVIVSPQSPSQAYVFVRRDGTVFFAVAYSWDSGNLYYVTQEGLRRTLARDALDLDATQQFNEQRGLSFHVPVAS
jgi:hypothetical protein